MDKEKEGLSFIKKGKDMIKQIGMYLTDRDYRFKVNAAHGWTDSMPDDQFLKRKFEIEMGYKLDLDNPKTFNEKLQWLKLHDRKPIYTSMVDKIEAKKLVSQIIGEQYIIPTIGTWNSVDEIDFGKLPDQFVLKCTHDSHGVIICRDKNKLDINSAKKQLSEALKRNYYYKFREWPYKDIQPRIIGEKYMEQSGDNSGNASGGLNDYKLQCFNGKFDNVFVAEGRNTERGVRFHYFDRYWNYIPYCPYDDVDIEALQKLKPQNFDLMIEIAETLARDLIQLRVDLYEINGSVYFGEMTFFSNSGFDTDITSEADQILGGKLLLPRMNV